MLTIHQIDTRRPGGQYDTLGAAPPVAATRSPSASRARRNAPAATAFQKMTAYLVEETRGGEDVVREVVQLER